MKIVTKIAGIMTAMILIFGNTARHANADEQLTPLAQAGDWTAVAHRSSMLSPPDVCMAGNQINPSQALLFRVAAEGNEVRVADRRWTLPAEVKGTIKIVVGNWTKQFDVESNTDDMIDASVSQEDLLAMLHEMDNASNMTIIVGNTKPMMVSLVGSTTVTNAFLTCAGIKGDIKAPGGNPFE
jgi:hypothetical protein